MRKEYGHLCLSRGKDQIIYLRDKNSKNPEIIEIRIEEITGRKVRIGITAPLHYEITRAELVQPEWGLAKKVEK